MNDLESATMPPAAAQHHPERRVIWSASEGQVVNAGVFICALLLCWLVLPVGYALYRYLKTASHVYTLTDQRPGRTASRGQPAMAGSSLYF